MPFVKINLPQSTLPEERKAISHAVHESLMTHFTIPADDYFQVVHELGGNDLLFPASYMGVPHTPKLVYIEITARAGRSVEAKKALYHDIAKKIAATTDLSINDVIIILTENVSENWSFGQGIAQMVS
ncbi:tautomerase family protein [Chitinophaga agrisoli]|uniref:Tautomerase family protein n=1 Tax=Chitinophaga agrisoli TaxID=2607653 RepID=A0A5B2VK43_9BACT|nr:tautomerase family protein [Chitinophaga agrisoli]KAA2239345.1 tautomerase family protein [Chitinophaga agrisoli]